MITEAIEATKTLERTIPLLAGSKADKDYQAALELVEELIENDGSALLIDLLATKIAEYERSHESFAKLDQALAEMPKGAAALRVLMDQYSLKQADLQKEIGGKSLVSQILNGKRCLTIKHIKALSERFHVPADIFI